MIPVQRLKIASGAASAKAGAHAGKSGADSGGQRAGGAVELDPVAAIAVGKDRHAHLLTVDADSMSSWSQLIAEVPNLVAKLAHTVGDRVNLELKTRGVKAAGGLGEGEGRGALPEKSEGKK